MAKKKKKAARKKPARRSLGAGGKRASRKKHMAYYCVRCGYEGNKKMRHHGKMMEKC